MAENLKTTRYRNGMAIPHVTSSDAWNSLNSGAWSNYNNSPANDAIYGKLYNWHAATYPDICPQGWHMPTDAEWQQLELNLGMPATEVHTEGARGVAQNIGGKMKAPDLWVDPPNISVTNETGFSGLPAGSRNYTNGLFYYINNLGYWWSTTEMINGRAWSRLLGSTNAGVSRVPSLKREGICIRCVRD
jgi:uncharacterized protein (TIGR02145 family)